MRAVIAYGFGDLGLHRPEANIQPENVGRYALVRRLGFQSEGYSPCYLRINGKWRDHDRSALLADTAIVGGPKHLGPAAATDRGALPGRRRHHPAVGMRTCRS
ncbi:MAG: GNAT family N-acetyltransferase [Chloroflexota bacterium]